MLGSGAFTLRIGAGQLLAAVLIGLFTIVNCLGIGRMARVQNALTSAKLLVIVGFIVVGFLAGEGGWGHFSEAASRTSETPLPAQFVVSLLWVMVAYSGWNAATCVAEEVREPRRTLPLAIALGTILVALLYLGLNLVFIYSTPLESMKCVIAIGSLSAANLFGPHVAGLFSALMALSIMSTVSAMVTIGPRVYHAMAKDRGFLRAAAEVHPRWNTPIAAIVSQGLCAALMTLTPFPELVVYIGMSLALFTVLAVVALLVFRRTRSDWERLAVVDFCYPLIPFAYILTGVAMMIYGVIWQPGPSLFAFGTIIAGAIVFRATARRRREAARLAVDSPGPHL